MSALRDIVAFIVVIGVLIFFHELGHYSVARWRGVIVETFSIGFGAPIAQWRAKSGTLWKIGVLPLGGYVKMRGWGEEADTDPPTPGSFASASLFSRALIVAAGPAANILLAFVVFLGLYFAIGKITVQPVVSEVVSNSPAAAAGLKEGDRILSLDGTKIADFEQLRLLVATRPGQAARFSIRRGGQTIDETIKLGTATMDGQTIGSLGVEGESVSHRRLGPLATVGAAAGATWQVGADTLSGLWGLIAHQKGAGQLGGTIRIAVLSGKVAAQGAASLLSFIATLSVNIALVNLLPIPVLDGGHLLYYLAEAVRGRPMPARAQEYGLRFGIVVLASVFMFTVVNDLRHLGVFGWFAHALGG